jgi:hypothetical protein
MAVAFTGANGDPRRIASVKEGQVVYIRVLVDNNALEESDCNVLEGSPLTPGYA